MGPMFRKSCSAIELAPTRSCSKIPAKTNPSASSNTALASPVLISPGAAAANPSALRGKSVVMTHDQLRFNLVHRVHCHPHHNQQRGAAKVKIHSQAIQHPVGHALEECPQWPEQMVQVNAGNHPL